MLLMALGAMELTDTCSLLNLVRLIAMATCAEPAYSKRGIGEMGHVDGLCDGFGFTPELEGKGCSRSIGPISKRSTATFTCRNQLAQPWRASLQNKGTS